MNVCKLNYNQLNYVFPQKVTQKRITTLIASTSPDKTVISKNYVYRRYVLI